MLRARRTWTSTLYSAFYWMGVALAGACVALTFAGNTMRVWPLEHSTTPLSWVVGIASILTFLAAEFCHYTASAKQPAASVDATTQRSAASVTAAIESVSG